MNRQGGYLLAKVHQLSGRIFARMLREHGIEEINPAQGRILFALWQDDAIPIRDLSAKTGLEKSTLTSMLDRLEKSGYIIREPSADDRRKIIIRRTEKDRAMQERYAEVSGAMIRCFYKGLSDPQIDSFEKTLEHILANLSEIEGSTSDEKTDQS
jgi:DNA-binding MarR family transcriptional regulator